MDHGQNLDGISKRLLGVESLILERREIDNDNI